MNRGYSPNGREKLSQILNDDGLKSLRAVPDSKDMYEMGPDKGPGQTREPNRYPPKEALPGFEDFTTAFFFFERPTSWGWISSASLPPG